MSPDRVPASGEPSGNPSSNDRLPFRVLLAVPEMRHIPTFAMAAERARAAFEEAALTGLDALATPIDQHAAEALQQGRYGAYRLVGTRTRLDPQTALYAPWAAFASAHHAEAFERDHPHLGLAALTEHAEAALYVAQIDGGGEASAPIEAVRSQARALARLRQCTAIALVDQPPRVSPCSF